MKLSVIGQNCIEKDAKWVPGTLVWEVCDQRVMSWNWEYEKNCWTSAASPVKQIVLELVELISFSRPHSRSVAPSAVASAAQLQSGHLHMMLGGTVSWTFLFGAFVRHWLSSASSIYPISGGERTFKEVVGWSLYIHRIKVNTKLTLWQVETSGAWMSKNGNILERSSVLHLGFSVCAFISPHVIQV